MNLLIYVGYFIIGSIIGYIIELIYRTIREKRLINPGFFMGPYLPIYGFGLLILNFISNIINIQNVIILSFISTILITTLEYFSGVFFVIKLKLPLWDYSKKRGNIRGIICIEFMLYWFLLSCFYYMFFYKIISFFVIKIVNSHTFCEFLCVFTSIFIFDIFLTTVKISKKRI